MHFSTYDVFFNTISGFAIKYWGKRSEKF